MPRPARRRIQSRENKGKELIQTKKPTKGQGGRRKSEHEEKGRGKVPAAGKKKKTLAFDGSAAKPACRAKVVTGFLALDEQPERPARGRMI